MVELLSIGRSKLPTEDPQLSTALRYHHGLSKERQRVRPGKSSKANPRGPELGNPSHHLLPLREEP